MPPVKLIADLHTHTVASNHAYATLNEMIAAAKEGGMQAMAVTDHGPAQQDSPHIWYFHNLLRVPCHLPGGFLLLRGVEANVLSASGELDMPDDLMHKLDWRIASIHGGCIDALSYDDATALWLNVAQNPLVDMIGHSEQACYRYDYARVTKAFRDNNKVVELNASSRYTRPGNREGMRQLALCCKENGTRVAVNSDAHSTYAVNNNAHVLKLLEEIQFPEELIVNSSMQRLHDELKRHGKDFADRAKLEPDDEW